MLQFAAAFLVGVFACLLVYFRIRRRRHASEPFMGKKRNKRRTKLVFSPGNNAHLEIDR